MSNEAFENIFWILFYYHQTLCLIFISYMCLYFRRKRKRNVNIPNKENNENPLDEYAELHRKLPRGYKLFPIISERYLMHHNFDTICFYNGMWLVSEIYLHGKYDIDLELTTKDHVVLKPITMDEFWDKLEKLQNKGSGRKAPKN